MVTCPCCVRRYEREGSINTDDELCMLCNTSWRLSAAYARVSVKLIDHDTALREFIASSACACHRLLATG